ncbi:hypothetical protein N7U66_12940 [Lacinutrix neustonica]|uniref:Uncharacterized protein n=1 Tax=Lacinutrix neustonica TaxID=2980107 RepID=A0A9E8MTJ5_9FLAO|nr:hypothetical protein [Lacinutrix neustonica]WAC01076.1 hypothetical protein N7U66_12940 [Lacinutrix neustonica]
MSTICNADITKKAEFKMNSKLGFLEKEKKEKMSITLAFNVLITLYIITFRLVKK